MEKTDEDMIDDRSYAHNLNFCLLLGVEDTGHVTIEHYLTNLSFFSLVLLSLFSYRDGGAGGGWVVSDRRPVSSVGRASDYRAGGLRFEPQTGPTLRVLK